MKTTLKNSLMMIFQITMPLFFLIGVVLILVQFYSILTVNAHLIVDAKKILYPWASACSGICMFVAFFYSYLK